MRIRMRACLLAVGALGLAAVLGGCVVVDRGGGGYGWRDHPHYARVARWEPGCR